MSDDELIPKLPRPLKTISQLAHPKGYNTAPLVSSESKRKAPDGDVEMANGDGKVAPTKEEQAKRQRTETNGDGAHEHDMVEDEDPALASARAMAAYIPFLEPENLLPPKMPTREEMEQFLLELRKKALLEEYFGNE